MRSLITGLFALLLSSSVLQASEEGGKRVLWIPLEGTVELGLSPYIQRGVERAQAENYDAVVLEVDTFGGRVDAAVEIRDALLEAKVPTIAWVNKRAISAGALISLATKTIYFAKGSTMGAATPIQLGQEGAKPVENKFVSYMRAEMGATAESQGRSRKIAEAMVKATEEIKGLVKKDDVLTLTDVTAKEVGFSDGTANTREAVLKLAKLEGAEIDIFEINWAEKIVRFLTEPTVSSLLMSVGGLAILMELYSPGFGIPGAIGVVCLGLFFFGKFLVNLAGWEEILFFILGLALIAVELFVMPGTFIFGILGLLVMVGALFFSGLSPKLPVDFSFPSVQDQVSSTVTSLAIFVGCIILLYIFISRRPLKSPLVLADEQKASSDRIEEHIYDRLIGQQGMARSDLRPSGSAVIDGERMDVQSEGSFIEAGEPVKVIRVEGNRIFVKKAEGSMK